MVRHANIFLPYYKVEETNPSLKPKSLVRHVKLFQFPPYYKVEQSKSEDFELDDVYVAPVDDPISSSAESMMSFVSDHVDQWFVVLMSSFAANTTTKVAKESEESLDFEPDDVYVALVDDPISNSSESVMSDHVDQWFVVGQWSSSL